MTATPFIDRVPKDPVENLRWRVKMRRAALCDVGLQEALYDAAMRDVLFFFNAFGWCYEPRGAIKTRPFCTWPHQDPVIVGVDKAISEAELTETAIDAKIDKSRAQGGTYIYLNVFLRRWIRDEGFSAGMVTRNERLVDSLTDRNTLMWKFDWALNQLPFWMLPKGLDPKKHRSLSEHIYFNPENGATVVGYSASSDVGRGGRQTVFACDEIGSQEFVKGQKDEEVMAALQDVTNCIILCSTFGADMGVFYDACTNDDSSGYHFVLDWKDNPIQTRKAFVLREGKGEAVRPEDQPTVDRYVKANSEALKKLQRRGFVLEGRKVSPWYISRCLRSGATPRTIARELDRNPRGAVGKVFDPDVLDRMKRECCRPPIWEGKPVFDGESLEFKGLIRQDGGPLKLWFKPGIDNLPPRRRFGVACDISAGGIGTTASNSAAVAVDMEIGEQMAEYVMFGQAQIPFARNVVGLCLWLWGAYLGWEDSGIAAPFAREVLEVLYYGNVYYREVQEIGSRVKTRKAGWWPVGDGAKGDLLERLSAAMDDGSYIPRSEDLIRECGEYEWEAGKIIHRPTKNAKMDGRAHGDRCIAAGVSRLLCEDRGERKLDTDDRGSHNPEYGSFLWREQQERMRPRFGSPEFGIHDVVSQF